MDEFLDLNTVRMERARREAERKARAWERVAWIFIGLAVVATIVTAARNFFL